MPRGSLELLSSGRRAELSAELTRIGRGKQCEFAVPESHTFGREHSLVVRRASGFWICDLNSSYGTWVARRGKKSERIGTALLRLEDGDVIDIQNPIRFHAEGDDLIEQALAEAVAAEPGDARRWQAYGAHLLAAGDPRGPRIELGSTELWWPGKVLSSSDLQLDLEWAHGHVRRAALRELRHSGNDLLPALRALLWAPATELLTELEISLLPGAQRQSPGTLANRIIEGVRRKLENSQLPALRHLRLSPPLDKPRPTLAGSPFLAT